MKILFLSQGKTVGDQPDYNASLCKVAEVVNIPFISYVEKHGGEAFYREVVRANAEFKPDLVFFQFFHSVHPGNPTQCVQVLRAAHNKPLVFGSIGDPFETGAAKYFGRRLPSQTLQLAACADALFSTSMGGIADELVACGARNVVFLPNAFCPMHFPYWEDGGEMTPERDITMLCSNNRLVTRYPIKTFTVTLRRRRIVNMLKSHFGERFSVFGRGWGGKIQATTVPFKEQVIIYQKSRVVVDAPAPILGAEYYSSDRAFFMLGSGVPLVHFHTPRFEKMLCPDDHAFYVHDLNDVCTVCERALRFTDEELADRRKRIVAFVKERHLIDHRVDTILSVAEALKAARVGGASPDSALRMIRMHHFLPEIDMSEELKFAVRVWRG